MYTDETFSCTYNNLFLCLRICCIHVVCVRIKKQKDIKNILKECINVVFIFFKSYIIHLFKRIFSQKFRVLGIYYKIYSYTFKYISAIIELLETK